MRKCPNCGAEYDSQLLKCPYCEYENIEAAQENYREKIEELVEEREEIKNLPKKVAAKRTKIIFACVAVFLVVIILGLVGVEVYQKTSKKYQAKKEQENKEIMESYLANKDYATFYSFYQGLDYAYLVYNKYDEISTIYYWYECIESDFELQFKDYNKGNKESHITWVALAMNEYGNMIRRADEYLNDNYRYGNEEHIQNICEMATARLKEMYRIDDAMIEEILAVEKERGADSAAYNELAEKVVENYMN